VEDADDKMHVPPSTTARSGMPLLPSRHYVSEHTRFIRELLEKKPQLEADQRIGRAIWWDKLPSDVEAEREMDQGRVAQKPYVYSSDNP
jgi:uncharacterized protein DUF3460